MKNGMLRGLLTGAVLGGSAAMLYGVMNWRTEQKWCRKAAEGGKWVAHKTGEWFDEK